MTTTDALPRDYLAQAKALRAKFYPATPPVVMRPAPKPDPDPVLEVYGPPLPSRTDREWAKVKAEARDAINRANSGMISPRYIIAAFAAERGLSVADLIGPSRRHAIARPRQDLMAELHRIRPDLSLVQIGKLLGGKDHTTVMHGIARSKKRREGGAA
jgi:hypothetical protein